MISQVTDLHQDHSQGFRAENKYRLGQKNTNAASMNGMLHSKKLTVKDYLSR
jgi:hypothetical protein